MILLLFLESSSLHCEDVNNLLVHPLAIPAFSSQYPGWFKSFFHQELEESMSKAARISVKRLRLNVRACLSVWGCVTITWVTVDKSILLPSSSQRLLLWLGFSCFRKVLEQRIFKESICLNIC